MTAAPDRTASAEWPVWSTTARVVVTDPAALRPARTLIRAHLAEVDAACSRFRPDSEIIRLARSAGQPVRISALLAGHLHAALGAARDTDGDLDPTIGTSLIALGYDRDFTLLLPGSTARAAEDRPDAAARKPDSRTGIRDLADAGTSHEVGRSIRGSQTRRPSAPAIAPLEGHHEEGGVAREATSAERVTNGEAGVDRRGEAGVGGRGRGPAGLAVPVALTVRPDWTHVRLDGDLLSVPAGVLLDLGATAKALAADHCAQVVADRLGCGVLVSLGGDIATAGPGPAGGWQVLVEDRPGEPRSRIALPAGAALATSSTLRRRWWRGGSLVHHIVDPRTGLAADPVWRTVSVAAGSCLAANTAGTAAVIRGRDALTGLRGKGFPSRLVSRDGEVITLCGWPQAASGDDEPGTRENGIES
ncbi:FAD:protein FMN transferase [Nocardia sp. NPDC059228]|uniref:FAD:protein FMN transferase n=1 Tax=Nocardia sp. NPDC059228 TaxID=3346777 RepID=UPI003678CB51